MRRHWWMKRGCANWDTTTRRHFRNWVATLSTDIYRSGKCYRNWNRGSGQWRHRRTMAKPTVRLDLTDALSIPCIYTAILPIDIRVNYVDDFGVGREFVLHIQKVKVDSKNIAVTCDE